MSAHLFLFYFGMLSMITPPVCLATIAAASVANTNFWQTGWAGVRLGFIAYVVPFLIVYRPELIFQGSLDAIAIASLQAVIGVIVLCYAVAGYMHHELGWLERIVLAVAGLAILTASLTTGFGMATAAIAIAVVGGLSWKGRRQAANVPA
jgi:TRAP-type uncharacterized transport system fused permease subunit